MHLHGDQPLTRKNPRVSLYVKAPERQQSAVTIRDHVLPLVRARGQRHQYGRAGDIGPVHLTTWERDPLRFVLRVPFDPLGTEAATNIHAGTALSDESTTRLPFGLDVWAAARVLSVAWNRTELVVITFRHGPWESEALALA